MKKLLIAGIFLVILMTGCISFGNGADGTATDSIARVSYGGWFWKTWRVNLLNDHPVGTDSGVRDQRYAIENNSDLIEQLQYYQETGERVKVYYKGNLFVFDWEYSDPEVIYKVEKLQVKE